MNEAGEVDGSPVVAGNEAAKVLKAVKAPLDAISVSVTALSCGIDCFRERLGGITASGLMAAMSARKALLS